MRDHPDRKAAAAFLARWTEVKIVPDEGERFREMAEADLLGLHEGNFAPDQSNCKIPRLCTAELVIAEALRSAAISGEDFH